MNEGAKEANAKNDHRELVELLRGITARLDTLIAAHGEPARPRVKCAICQGWVTPGSFHHCGGNPYPNRTVHNA